MEWHLDKVETVSNIADSLSRLENRIIKHKIFPIQCVWSARGKKRTSFYILPQKKAGVGLKIYKLVVIDLKPNVVV